MLNLNDLEKSGVVVRKFCGLEIEESIGCPNEAVGDITAVLDDGIEVPIPVCDDHLKMIQSQFDVEHLSLG